MNLNDRYVEALEQHGFEPDEAQRKAWSGDLARLGPQRARLYHALRRWREQRGETSWDG